ncbi:substrate-binding domain-containing protein [Marinobacterium rhizophilum]|uniref:Substrate-binding domain-containing protein n=1 Tax=Marinobacterium rhizophilum TaxID=420402 RepID=A0ABY5HN73_9GAMM|nr:substrate-binding domain-containing protein [Marinobacterium rhizophilum]UTW13860.1 substrate-binding domain-containing protein [Marinobacterium rhizophilum]
MRLAWTDICLSPRPNLSSALTLLCLLLMPLHAFSGEDYTPLDDYLQQHPEQTALMAQFADVVSGPAVALTQPQTRPVRIAIIYPAFQVSDYWRLSIKAFEARLKELNIRYELQVHLSSLDEDPAVLATQLQESLDREPDYLVFTLGALIHRQLIETILAHKKTRLIVQNVTTPLQDWSAHPPFLYVGFDHQAGTRLLAGKMLTGSTRPQQYAMLYSSHGYISQLRGDTFIRLGNNSQEVRLLGSYYTDNDRDLARAATLQELDRHPDLNMLYACSTDIALAAIEALRLRGKLDQVLLNGWGGGEDELEAIRRGDLDLTVMRMNDDNGVAMAEAIKAELEQRTDQVPQVFSGEMVLVTKDTPEAELQALTVKAFRYSATQ